MKERIKQLRKALGFTQKQFAERIGVKQNTVSQYEFGRNDPTDTVLHLICQTFHVNPEWLKNGIGEMFTPDASDELDALAKRYHLSDGMYVVIEKLVNLNPEMQAVVVNLVQQMTLAMPENPNRISFPRNEDMEDIAAEEAAYREALNIAPPTNTSVSSTTGGKGKERKRKAAV